MSPFQIVRVVAIQVLLAASIAGASLSVVIPNETVPPGGTVQLKFSLAKPALVAAGELSIDLDPTMFASVATASTFSSNGDAGGFAQVGGLHVDVHFSSPSGGIGQLPGVPVIAVTAVVLPTAAVGKTASVTADPTGSIWTDPQGNLDSVSVAAGTVTIGGSLSITSVEPGGGILASGTIIEIDGTGFSSATTVEIDGADLSGVQIVSPAKILATLGGPTELTGKRIHVLNPDGSEVDEFPFLPGVPINLAGDNLNGVIPILPLQAYTAATFVLGGSLSESGMAIRNPNSSAVELVLDTTGPGETFEAERSLSVPAGASIFDLSQMVGIEGGAILVIASAPVQIVQLTEVFSPGDSATTISAASLSIAAVPPLQVGAGVSNGSLSWALQTGSAAPQPQSIALTLPEGQPPANVTVSIATSAGASALSVTPAGVVTCQPNAVTSLLVSLNPAGLAPGIYRGTITIAPVATASRPVVVPAVIPIAITVTASSLAQTVIPPIFLEPNNSIYPMTLPSGLFSGPVSINIVTDSGGNWLSAATNAASAPTSITIAANAANFAAGSYTGDVVVTGSGNTLVVPVNFLVDGSVRLTAGGNAGTVGSLNFAAQTGAGTLPAQTVAISTEDCIPTECFNVNPDLSSLAATVATHSGGNWLSAIASQGTVSVTASAQGLGPGVYLGAVALTATGIAAGQFPVVLVVEGGTLPALAAGPGLVSISVPAGANSINGSGPTSLCVTSSSVPITVSDQVSTSNGGGWLHVTGAGSTTPTCLAVSVDATSLAPGSYSGNIAIGGGQQSVIVAVSATVTGPPVGPPLLGSVANAASEIPMALSPGEIIAIHGQNLGPRTPAGPPMNAQGLFATTVAGVGVSIGGFAAPILYASQNEINAVVPYEAAAQNAISIQVQNGNGKTPQWDIPSAESAPGIFTADGTGTGGGAILNQDSSLNSPSNPAALGSVVQIFATGEGLTNPAGETGSVAHSLHQPVLPVTVAIGGVPAQVVYAGSAPLEIQGLLQVNAIIPQAIAAGNAVPVLLTVGQAQSQTATIAVH